MKTFIKRGVMAIAVTLCATTAAICGPKSGSAREPVRVACIGNSITYGLRVDDRENNAYPFKLQKMLGPGYEVRNFGNSGATLLRHGHKPYSTLPEYGEALDFKPQVAVIHLGINDTDPRNWPNYSDEFVSDYLKLIDTLRAVQPDVRIIVANLTPIGPSHHRWRSGTLQWRDSIRNAITRVADIARVELIDFETPLIDSPQLLPDAIHPNVEGSEMLADYTRGAITGDWGGLALSPLFTDGMVLQRRQPLHISGRTDAGRRVTVTLGNQRRSAVADGLGHWDVTFLPMEAVTGLTLTVDDGHTTRRFNDVAIGEVWIASGQSNMEFPLSSDIEKTDALAKANDPDLRLFNMRAAYVTNANQWDSIALQEVNRLNYYKPAQWQASSPETAAAISAVAWYFGRMLRDSLDVPVGIICNAVGGAPAESFIDQQTLRHNIPEILVDWRKNDYLMPWVRKRAGENAPADSNPGQRHPYEPGYLYSAGVKPLGNPDIAGVIWYQGESNAHNIEVHEQLFPLLVDTWRQETRRPDLPVYFVQLSGINRPSWPWMRDSQRRLAETIPGTGMAVSYDYGDSLDVHPRVKRPVGERLARIALNRTYGHEGTEYSGPTPIEARADANGEVTVVMQHSHGMRTSDGEPVRTFEVASVDGLFVPAIATIDGDRVILSGHNIATPRYVRYGWQPFSRANLINDNNLPTSTFKMNVINSSPSSVDLSVVDGEPRGESGIEHGVSAAYAGIAGAMPVMAGGCNFPQKDPLAADAVKCFYKGIYSAEPDGNGLKWKKIGELPEAAAYGVSAPTAEGLFIAGGQTPEGSLRSAMIITVDASGKCTVTPLAPLPAAVDNAYAASDGMTVYVVGGNIDGKPSRKVWVYDVAKDAWGELPDMPGNPRVQPVAAVSGGKLYVWGGFAGRTADAEPTFELGGLCYDLATQTWTDAPAAEDADGYQVGLAGGVAMTLADGRVLATGGVNPEIFLSAIRAQPADYLTHDPEWYRFGKAILLFDPAKGIWTEAGRSQDAARAGAAVMEGVDGAIYLLGGELKPRIRTPRAMRINISK